MARTGFGRRLAALLIWMLASAPALAAVAAPVLPWQQAQGDYRSALADFQAHGFAAIAPHVPALVADLAAAGNPIRKTNVVGGTTYVLTENSADALRAMLEQAGAHAAPGARAVAVSDPYPAVCLILGSYYDEYGRFGEAVRVLDIGLAVAPGDPTVLSERSAALEGLHRWADAVANAETGLALANLPPSYRARFLRGRGLALTELGRLDAAEASYRQSLALDPGNAIATHELAYIARLRAGGPRATTELTAPNRPH